MKKKLLMYVGMLLLAFSFTACSGSGEEPSSKETETEKVEEVKEGENKSDTKVDEEEDNKVVEEDSTSKLSDDLFDCQFSIDGVIYQVPMWYSDLEANGWIYSENPDKVLYSKDEEYAYWNRTGMMVTTRINNASINMKPVKESAVYLVDLVDLNETDGIDIVLPKGIRTIGSTQDDIIKAYGEPSHIKESQYGNTITYKLDDTKEIVFRFMEDGQFYNVYMKSTLAGLEGIDNTINPDVKADFIEYVVPTELGTNIMSSNFMLGGNLYTLPCPVTEFLNNGFVVQDEYVDEIIPAGGESNGYLELDGKVLKASMTNYSDYATTPENCYVDFIFNNDYDGKTETWDIELPSGLKVGSTQKELLDVLGAYEYSESESWSGFTYDLIESGTGYRKELSFSIEDGIVDGFDISNNQNPKYYIK